MPGRILEHSPNYRLALKCTVLIHHCASCFLIRNRKNKLGSCFQYIKCYENNMQYGFHRQRQAFSNYLQIPCDFSSSVFFSRLHTTSHQLDNKFKCNPTDQFLIWINIQLYLHKFNADLNKMYIFTHSTHSLHMGKANSKKLSLVAVLNCITYSRFKIKNSVCTSHLSGQDIRQWCNDLVA